MFTFPNIDQTVHKTVYGPFAQALYKLKPTGLPLALPLKISR